MTRRRNEHIASICERSNEPDQLRAVQHLIGGYKKPGESLEDVARKLGVNSVVREKLPFEGGVFPRGTSITIKINCMSPPARQKFTLAHELAHLILRPGHAKTARRCVSSSDLEDACDILAAELLMPLAEVKNSTSGIGSIEDLLTLARRFGSSLNATAIRVKEVAGWKESIGLWKWHGFATELWYVGKRLWPERHVDLSIFEMALRTSRTLRSSEEVNGQSIGVYRVNSQVRHLGNNHLLGLLERG